MELENTPTLTAIIVEPQQWPYIKRISRYIYFHQETNFVLNTSSTLSQIEQLKAHQFKT